MTKQTDLIDELGGDEEVAFSLCAFSPWALDPCALNLGKIGEGEADEARLRRRVERVRKRRDQDHIAHRDRPPHWAGNSARQHALAEGLPVPKELQEPQIDAV